MEERKKKRTAVAGMVVFLVFTGAVCWFAGKPMVEFVSRPDQLRSWVTEWGPWSRIAFLGMMAFQIVIAFLPGEPLEVGAGYAFGAIEGTGLCLLGALLGSVAVFLFVKKFGIRFVALFFPVEKIRSLQFLQDEKRLNLIVYLLFLVPGTPKDVMTYVVGLTPMKLSFWIFLTLTARIPSVITSTVGGDALSAQNFDLAIAVFAATALISGLGLLAYRRWVCRRGKKAFRPRENGQVPGEKDKEDSAA